MALQPGLSPWSMTPFIARRQVATPQSQAMMALAGIRRTPMTAGMPVSMSSTPWMIEDIARWRTRRRRLRCRRRRGSLPCSGRFPARGHALPRPAVTERDRRHRGVVAAGTADRLERVDHVVAGDAQDDAGGLIGGDAQPPRPQAAGSGPARSATVCSVRPRPLRRSRMRPPGVGRLSAAGAWAGSVGRWRVRVPRGERNARQWPSLRQPDPGKAKNRRKSTRNRPAAH